MSGETVYVRGENGEVVRLSQVLACEDSKELVNYFWGIQDSRMVKFKCSETIADNLKVEVFLGNTHIKSGMPFYIVEFNDSDEEFSVWRSDGQWGADEAVVQGWYDTLHGNHRSAKKTKSDDWREFVGTKRMQEHPNKIELENNLKKLNVDWSNCNASVFWKEIDNHCRVDAKQASKHATASTEGFHHIVLLALIKAELSKNKHVIKNQIDAFHARMSRKHRFRKSRKDSIMESISEDSCEDEEMIRVRSLSPNYTTATHSPRAVEDIDNETSKQIMSNFNMLFKPIVENFEDVYLDKYSKYPERKRRKQATNRVSKIK